MDNSGQNPPPSGYPPPYGQTPPPSQPQYPPPSQPQYPPPQPEYAQPQPPPQQPQYPPQQPGYPPQQPGYPPQQPGYPPPQPPPYGYAPTPPAYGGAPSSGMPPSLAIVLAYLIGIIGPIIVLVVEKQNQFVRFQAIQAFLVQCGLIALEIALTIVGTVLAFGLHGFGLIFSGCLVPLISLGVGIYFLVVMIQAATGKNVRIPYVAEYADKMLPTFLR